jgi:carbon storage regulator
MIGDSIEVVVVDIRGDRVRLGITAPREVSVHRREVWEALLGELTELPRMTDPEALPRLEAFLRRPLPDPAPDGSQSG